MSKVFGNESIEFSHLNMGKSNLQPSKIKDLISYLKYIINNSIYINNFEIPYNLDEIKHSFLYLKTSEKNKLADILKQRFDNNFSNFKNINLTDVFIYSYLTPEKYKNDFYNIFKNPNFSSFLDHIIFDEKTINTFISKGIYLNELKENMLNLFNIIIYSLNDLNNNKIGLIILNTQQFLNIFNILGMKKEYNLLVSKIGIKK